MQETVGAFSDSTLEYFVLIVPGSIVLLGVLLFLYWFFAAKKRFLYWFAWGFVLPGLALAIHSVLNPSLWAKWACLIILLCLFGIWAQVHAVVLRYRVQLPRYLVPSIVLVTFAIAVYYSLVDDVFRYRLAALMTSIAILYVLPLPGVIKSTQRKSQLEKVLKYSYAFLCAYAAVRAMVVLNTALSTEMPNTVRQNYWLILLGIAFFQSLWFAILIVACTVDDTLLIMKEERNRDPLTNLLNRRAFSELTVHRYAQSDKVPRALLVCDLDYFKSVNDRWGHHIGDLVLQQVAEILQSNVRSRDLVARFGGEEFVILLDDIDLDAAYVIAQRIRKSLSSVKYTTIPITITITASFGLTPVESLADLNAAQRRANYLLLEAKRSGRDMVLVDSNQHDSLVAGNSAVLTRRFS